MAKNIKLKVMNAKGFSLIHWGLYVITIYYTEKLTIQLTKQIKAPIKSELFGK